MVEYYGVMKNIIELDYRNGHKVMILFDYNWINDRLRWSEIKKDDFGFTLINFDYLILPPDTLVLYGQAHQAFYVQNPIEKEWYIIVRTTPRDYFDMGMTTHHDLFSP